MVPQSCPWWVWAVLCAYALQQARALVRWLRASQATRRSRENGRTEAELYALAAVANVDAADAFIANFHEASRGEDMAYSGCHSDAAERLEAELRARGVFDEDEPAPDATRNT
jgi:hypothetical protein